MAAVASKMGASLQKSALSKKFIFCRAFACKGRDYAISGFAQARTLPKQILLVNILVAIGLPAFPPFMLGHFFPAPLFQRTHVFLLI
jgi:hypothetical protein